MARANCILSGSRAAGLSFRKTYTSFSGRDFYVFGSGRCIGAALASLEYCGVCQDSPHEQLELIAVALSLSPVELDQVHFE